MYPWATPPALSHLLSYIKYLFHASAERAACHMSSWSWLGKGHLCCGLIHSHPPAIKGCWIGTTGMEIQWFSTALWEEKHRMCEKEGVWELALLVPCSVFLPATCASTLPSTPSCPSQPPLFSALTRLLCMLVFCAYRRLPSQVFRVIFYVLWLFNKTLKN